MKALGKINVDGKDKILYIQNTTVNGNESYVYYLDDEDIGGYDPDISEVKIIFRQNSNENELSAEIKDKIVQLVEEKLETDKVKEIPKDYEEKKVREIEKVLGIKEGKIKKIIELDLKQEIKSDRNEENGKKQEIKRSTTKDVNIKQEMEFKDKATDMKTLGGIIEKAGKMPKEKGKKFEKMGVIESDELKNLKDKDGNPIKVNTTRYSFVAIATDGTVVPMDLEQDYQEGRNSTEVNYQVKQNGEVERDDVLSRFKIGEGTFSIKNGNYGELQVYHSPRKTLSGGTHSLDRQLETNNVWEIKKNERDLAEEYGDGYRSVEEGYNEAKKIERRNSNRKDCDKIEIADIDGEESTKGHNHDDEVINEIADELVEITVVDNAFTKDEVKNYIRGLMEKNPSWSNEKLSEIAKELITQEAKMMDRTREK